MRQLVVSLRLTSSGAHYDITAAFNSDNRLKVDDG
jgi:hypothetical protein